MDEGWITLHRKIMKWGWYTDANTMRVFLHLLLKANHQPGEYLGEPIERGQLITGLISLEKELKLTQSKIRTSLAKLERSGEIKRKITNRFSVITICKYDSYQTKSQADNKQITNKSQTNHNQIATNNNVNNENNLNNEKKDDGQTSSLSLFIDSGITEEDVKRMIEEDNDIKEGSAKHYYNRAVYWSAEKNEMKRNWLLAIKEWMYRDNAEGKLVKITTKQGGISDAEFRNLTGL